MNLSAAHARPWDVGWGSAGPSLRRARPRRPCTETMRARGHGMWGGEAPARPSAAHGRGRNCVRLRQSCTGTLRTRGHGMWGEEAPARPSAAHGRGRNCARRGGRAQERCERAGLGARCGKRGHGRRAMGVRPGGSARPPAAAARPLPRPHGASLKVPRQRAKTARGRRIRRSRACHSHCLRAVCVSPASRAPGAPCSRSPHRRSRRARRSRPAPATARWYGNGF